MPFLRNRTRLTLNMYQDKDGKWVVYESLSPKYTSDSEKWFNTHRNIQFVPEYDGGDNPLSSGCASHYTGYRDATTEEINRHLEEMDKREKEARVKEEAEKKVRIKKLEVKAKELGYKIVPLKSGKNNDC